MGAHGGCWLCLAHNCAVYKVFGSHVDEEKLFCQLKARHRVRLVRVAVSCSGLAIFCVLYLIFLVSGTIASSLRRRL